MKRCTSCGERKLKSEFNTYKNSRDGLNSSCRACLGKAKFEARQRLKSRSDEEIEAAAAVRGPKTCRKCQVVKGHDEYPRDRGRRDGRSTMCLTCAAATTIYYNSLLTPEERRRRKAVHYQNNREQNRERRLKYNFGITGEEYSRMFESQGGVCAICDQPEFASRNGAVIQLSVDHDHTTGVVRQLLCSACNKAVGYFRDNPELMRRAALYIENHNEIHQRRSSSA